VQRGLDTAAGENHDQQRDEEYAQPATAVDAAVTAARAGISAGHEALLVTGVRPVMRYVSS
jgi:hypothetical protein